VKATETLTLGRCVETQVEIEGLKEWSNRNALIDLGANANFVSQVCVKECDLTPICRQALNVELPDGKTLQAYGSHIVTMRALNSQRTEHKEQEQSVAANFDWYNVILGMSWLWRHNPRIDWLQYHWSYPNVTHNVELVSPRQFESLIGQGATAYVIFARESRGNANGREAIDVRVHALEAVGFPFEYRDYCDVLSGTSCA
jgi:hypothetical protein